MLHCSYEPIHEKVEKEPVITETGQDSDKSPPSLIWHTVQIRKFVITCLKRPQTPISCNWTTVASTHDVSEAFSMSANATNVCDEARILKTLTNEPTKASAPQRNPPCEGWSCWLISGAMHVCIKCSSTLKQHDASDTRWKLHRIDGVTLVD